MKDGGLTDAPAAHPIIQVYALDDRIPEVDLVDHPDVVEAIVADDVAALDVRGGLLAARVCPTNGLDR